MAHSLVVPRRTDLLDQMRRANRFAWYVLIAEVIAIALLALVIDWGWVMREPIMTTVAIGAMVCPFVASIAMQLATKKKRLEDLKETTRFGQYDKYLLQKLFRSTLATLRLPEDNLPVYVVANTSMNAAAMHVGLGRLLKSLNGIYLNRQALHKLEPAEVQDLMGHELGHYYKYYLVIDRFRIVTLALGSLLGILVIQRIGLDGYLGYLTVAFATSAAWWLSSLPYSRNAAAIEYLCDDFGAQVSGVFASIQGLLKIGLSSELECLVMHKAILSEVAGQFNPSELIEAISAGIPYGHSTREEIEDRVKRELNTRAAGKKKSLGGLLRYMWNSDVDAEAAEELEEEAKKLARLQAKPRLNWESVLTDPSRVQFNEAQMRELVSLIESRPDELLFRIPKPDDGVHPPLENRILYLWHNRAEIESQLRSRI